MKKESVKNEKWTSTKVHEKPLLVDDKVNNREWYANTCYIFDKDGRIVCEVGYQTDFKNNGYGKNETIEKWEKRFKLIAAAPEMLKALIEISEGKGAYDTDPLKHASNVIEESKRIALETISKALD